MGLEPKINKLTMSFTGFNGATSTTVGTINLDVYSSLVICSQTFMVIDNITSYNNIAGKPWIRIIDVVTSVTHQKICYLVPMGKVRQVNNDQMMTIKSSIQGI